MSATPATFSKLLAWRPGRLAKNTATGTALYGVRLTAQGAYFLLLARWMGPDAFGYFGGIWVLAGFLATFANLGYPILVLKASVAHSRATRNYLGQGIAAVGLFAPLLGLILILVANHSFPTQPHTSVALLIAISEIAIFPILTLITALHQGREQITHAYSINAALWTFRLIGLVLTQWVFTVDLTSFAASHCITTLAIVLLCVAQHRQEIQRPTLPKLRGSSEAPTALSFALSNASLIAYTELNQSIVLSLCGSVAAGQLAVAYKSVTMISAPLTVICYALTPRLLDAARRAPHSLGHLLLPLVAPMLIYVLICWIVIRFGADIIGQLFGPEYSAANEILRNLSVLPLFMVMRLLAVYTLFALNRQRVRLAAESICLAAGFSLNYYLISTQGLKGAVTGSIATEALIAFLLVILTWLTVRSTMANHTERRR